MTTMTTCPCCGYYQVTYTNVAVRCHECDAPLPTVRA